MNTNEEMNAQMVNTEHSSTAIDSDNEMIKKGTSNNDNSSDDREDNKPHNKAVGHILSIIALALAIVSFDTTRQGMSQYIFKGWLATLVSFGVQAMLFCLSMTIPRYWNVMRRWGRNVMAILLVALIIVSSGFTYVYAADYVYGSTKYINSGNSVVRLHSAELKAAKEYVNAAMKYYRIEMPDTISAVSIALNSLGTAAQNESITPTATPDATPTPVGIPDEITTPKPYDADNPDADNPNATVTPEPARLPGAVFYADHDYPETNITVIVVAEMDALGYIDENSIRTMYFDNQPATVDECNSLLNEIKELKEEYERRRNEANENADKNENTQEGVVSYKDVRERYRENARQYDRVVSKLDEIRRNIEFTRTSIEDTIDNKTNEILTEMLNEQDADEIINKVNELKTFVMQQQNSLDSDTFANIVNLLQQISITAENYGVLMEIKGNLDEIDSNTDYSEYLDKTVNAQEVANAIAASEDDATAKPKDDATATSEPTPIPTHIEKWKGDSNEMLIELAKEIRGIPRVESSDKLLDRINIPKSWFAKYNPIKHADKLQDMIRNEITKISPLEETFSRLFKKYCELAWATLIIAFVCDLTALGAGIVNNKLAVYNLNPMRVGYDTIIDDAIEIGRGETKKTAIMNRWRHKKTRIEYKNKARTLRQAIKWDKIIKKLEKKKKKGK